MEYLDNMLLACSIFVWLYMILMFVVFCFCLNKNIEKFCRYALKHYLCNVLKRWCLAAWSCRRLRRYTLHQYG